MSNYFIAIDLPQYTQEALAKLQDANDKLRWVLPEKYHITLAFLGPVADEDIVPRVCEVLRHIQLPQFFLPIQGVGRFPVKGEPRVVWVGVGHGHPFLFQLNKKIIDTLLPLGFEPDYAAFIPHITLARCTPGAQEMVRQFLKKHADFEAAPIKVERFSLIESINTYQGHRYSIVEDFALGSVS